MDCVRQSGRAEVVLTVPEQHAQPPASLLTINDVAAWLNVSRSLVYQLVEAKKIPVCRIGNGRGTIRFRHEDVEEYVSGTIDRREPVTVPTQSRTRLKHVRVRTQKR